MSPLTIFKPYHSTRSNVLWCLTTILITLLMSFSTVNADTALVRVGIYNFQPIVFRDATNQPKGIGVTVLEHTADQEGWRLEFVDCTWIECLEGLESGRIDIVPGASYTAERAERYRFSRQGLLMSYSAIYLRKGSPIQEIDHLAGKTIAVHRKGVIGDFVKQLLRQRNLAHGIIEAEDYDGVFEHIESGRADAGAVNHYYGHLNHSRFSNISDTPLLLGSGQMFFIGSKKSRSELMNALDLNLAKLIADDNSPYHRELTDLGYDQWAISRPKKVIPLWLKLTLSATAFVAILFVAMSLLLKQQVRKKTFDLSQSNRQLQMQINERLDTEKQLNAIQTRIASMMGYLPGIVYRCRNDATFTLETLSSGAREILGIRKDDFNLNHQDLGLKTLAHPHDHHILKRRQINVDDHLASYSAVYRLHLGKDRYQYVSDRGIFIRDESGKIDAFEGFISEITSSQDVEIQMRREKEQLHASLKGQYRFGNIIGKSKPMRHVFDLIMKAAASDKSVIVQGESGTGKELVARAIHEASSRCDKAFVTVNCGAIPETLIESEFFGYQKGAFTGARQNKPGLLTMAHEGTLFLDEIGDIPLAAQLKLLRAIEGGGFTPVGGKQPLNSDVRIVAATNKDLNRMVEDGRMRADFYYRIGVLPISLPPLRDRREDIPLLIDFFLENYGSEDAHIPANVLEKYKSRPWPGNVRELQNAVWRYLTLKEMPGRSKGSFHKILDRQAQNGDLVFSGKHVALKDAVEAFEKAHIEKLLSQHDWNRRKVAKMLKINRRTLFNRIKKYGIAPKR